MSLPHDILGIYLTDKCSYKCLFCSLNNPSQSEEHMTQQDIVNILEQNKDGGFCGVALWGGEPSIRNDFFDILGKIRDYGYNLVIIETNGDKFADFEFLKRTVEQGANYFIVSIHGATQEVQDKTTQINGSFTRVVRAIKTMKENDVFVRTNTVVNKNNYRQLPQIMELLVNLNVDHINISALRTTGAAIHNFELVTPTFREIEKYVKQAFKQVIPSGITITFDVFPFCTVKGYEHLKLEWTRFKMHYRTKIINDFTLFTNDMLKAKGPMCRGCGYLKECGGVFKAYVDYYGWDEFGY